MSFAIYIFHIAVCSWVMWFIIGGNGKGTPCLFESAPLKKTHVFIDQAAYFPLV